jgi:hypothetical protein
MKLSQQKVRGLVLCLCALAALRVFVFAAAFPFFNNVDEQLHVDLVVKYSRGNIPRGIEPFAPETARYLALYRTPEYFVKPEQYGGQYPPPNWEIPQNESQKILDQEVPSWESRANHESGEPPLYYATAGAWMSLGRALGVRGLALLYWVRFLNIGLAATLVWIGHAAAKLAFPENQFLHLAVPVLLALWPQSAFYSIQGDAFSPVCFGIAFLGIIKMLKGEQVGVSVPIWAGLALAATCLVKTSNFTLPFIAIIVIALKIFWQPNEGPVLRPLVTLAVFIVSLALPLGLWFVWNQQHFGDLTATKTKIELLGWTAKPLSEWLPHPILTIHGLSQFWRELIASFWRGEFVWHLERMASGAADIFYAICTALVLIVSLVICFRNKTEAQNQRWVLWLALLSFVSIVGFMVLLSIRFDFADCPYPSREHPYFTSGRLLNAAAVPFFLMFAFAIDRIGTWSKRQWVRWSFLGATAIVLIVSQLQVNAPTFSSRYNFFHRTTL